MVIFKNIKLKAVAWTTVVAFGLVGCSGGADIAEDSTQFESPTGRTISNSDSPATGGGITNPSNPTTTAPDAPSVTGGDEETGTDDPDAVEAGADPTNQDILDRLDELEAQGDETNASAEEAAANAAQAIEAAKDAEDAGDKAALVAGIGAGVATLAAILTGVIATKSINKNTDEEAAITSQHIEDSGAYTDSVVRGEVRTEAENTRNFIQGSQDAQNELADERQDETNAQFLIVNESLEKISSDIQTLNTSLDGYKSTVTEYQELVSTAISNFDEFKQELATSTLPELQSAIEQAQDDAAAKQELIAAAKTFVEAGQAHAEVLAVRISLIEDELALQEGENLELQQELENLQASKAELDSQLAALGAELVVLEAIADAEASEPLGVASTPAPEAVPASLAEQYASIDGVRVFDANGAEFATESFDGSLALFVLSPKQFVSQPDGSIDVSAEGKSLLQVAAGDVNDASRTASSFDITTLDVEAISDEFKQALLEGNFIQEQLDPSEVATEIVAGLTTEEPVVPADTEETGADPALSTLTGSSNDSDDSDDEALDLLIPQQGS